MDDNELADLFALMALTQLLGDEDDKAEAWAARIPRSHRGRVRIALDDFDLILSRLGRRYDG